MTAINSDVAVPASGSSAVNIPHSPEAEKKSTLSDKITTIALVTLSALAATLLAAATVAFCLAAPLSLTVSLAITGTVALIGAIILAVYKCNSKPEDPQTPPEQQQCSLHEEERIIEEHFKEIEPLLSSENADGTFSSNISPEALEKIEIFSKKLKEMALSKELKDLEKRLVEAVGDSIAKEIMGDWDYLGRDIQEMSAPLDEERKEQILAKAHEAKDEILRKAEEALQKIQKDWKKPENASEILSQMKSHELKRVLNEKFPRSERLDKIKFQYVDAVNKNRLAQLATAIVLKMTAPSHCLGTALEASFVEEMGYRGMAYLNKQRSLDKLLIVLDELLAENLSSLALKDLMGEVAKRACIERLKTAGVEKKFLPYAMTFISSALSLRDKLIKFLGDIHFDAYKDINHRQMKKVVLSLAESMREDQADKEMQRFFDEGKALKGSPTEELESKFKGLEVEIFRNLNTKNKKQLLSDKLRQATANEIALVDWYSRYGKHLSVELVQGLDDSQEALRGGCCKAIVDRVSRKLEEDAAIPDEMLDAGRILPLDRYNQAHYAIDKKKGDGAIADIEKVGRNSARALEMFSGSFTKEALKKNIIDSLPQLSKRNGVLRIGIWFVEGGGHSTFIQIDPKKKLYRAFDPNLGLLHFVPQEGENLAEKTIDCYIEMLEALYTYDSIGEMVGSCSIV